MKKLYDKNFKNFKVTYFFEVLNTRNKLSKSNITENGEIPLYSSSEENNGIIGYTNKAADYKVGVENPFYIIFGDHTKSMYIANNDFCVTDNVKVLIPKVYNKYAIKFILTIWKKNIPNLGYSRHWSVAKDAVIKIPVNLDGHPDWDYMSNYMINIEQKVKKHLDILENLDK